MDPHELFFQRALRRIHLWILILSGAGLVAAAIYGGRPWAAGYSLGTAAGWLNFRWLKQLVTSLGEAAAGKPPKARVAVMLGLRYLLLGAGAYVIVKFTALSVAAALIGLFVPTAAVILEILFELIYAGT
ncbi:MAG TPA: ATP synthase subunit I [Bryobacteraceae bacterium]|nr:ATP synthase subunit I [Bryobacteraceae bacterium]